MNRILIIDNMQSNVELMVNHLYEAGYDVITANDGVGGIKKAKLFKPDLIVLDLSMPKMSSFDICKTLKADPITKNMMILVVTSMPSRETRTRAFEIGADEYMEKTFDKVTFLTKIKTLLRIKSLNDKLKENYAVLEKQNKQFEIQLEMARHIQQALISEINMTCSDVSIASCYRPAQSVGGDIYDVVTLNPDTIAVFIADVSGYGVSAALLTSMLKIMFRNAVGTHSETARLLSHMNEAFYEAFESSYVNIYACALFALIDMKNKEIRYSCAGSAPPLFVSKSKKMVTELMLSGRPLGLMGGSVYQSETVKYSSGDVFFLHTDGLCDSMYKDKPEIFVSKLSEALLTSNEEAPAEIIDDVLSEFYDDSVKAENDDVSIIVCKMGKVK